MSSAKVHFSYRADIDGLRAIAVCSVLAFHGGLERIAPGGFVGVDVFFVISGFLITKSIMVDLEAGRFSLSTFYYRRARRILPALLVLYIALLAVGMLVQFPFEVQLLSKSTIFSTFFLSNIFFYYTGGYFDHNVAQSPVLHTWSLSVEEQFYIVFPVIMWLAYLYIKRYVASLIFAIAAASFVAAVFMTKSDSSAAFYLMQYRAWELMLGALLNFVDIEIMRRGVVAEIMGALGLIMVMLSVYYMNASSEFPGLGAVPPCLGSALLIYSGRQHTLSAKLLSLPPARFLGLISYSLYLWHWPVIMFTSLLHEPQGFEGKAVVLAACFVIAVFSWFFIERPFRTPPFRFGVPQTLVISGCSLAAVACLALIVVPVMQFVRPTSPRISAYLDLINLNPVDLFRAGDCFLTSQYTQVSEFHAKECLSMAVKKQNVLIIGDSEAAHLWPGYANAFPNINFMQATASGCRPVRPFEGVKRCVDLMTFIYDDFLRKNRPDVIVLSGRWLQSDISKVERSVAYLLRYADRVIVSGPAPEYTQSLPRLMAVATSKNADPEEFAAYYRQPNADMIDVEMKKMTLPLGSEYISIHDILCHRNCMVFASDGMPLQFDHRHFTLSGSWDIAKVAGAKIFGAQSALAR